MTAWILKPLSLATLDSPLAGSDNSHRSHDIISPLIGGDVRRTEGVSINPLSLIIACELN